MSQQQTYRVTLSDGREFDVETEGGPPSEQDVLASLGEPSVSSQLKTETGPSKWSDRLGLNEGTESRLKGFLRGAGAGAVDMAQGVARNVVGQAAELAKALPAADSPFAEPITEDEAARIDRSVPESPGNFSGYIGQALPLILAMTAGGGKAIGSLPSKARAASNFETVMKEARDLPVDVSSTREIAARIEDLAAHGAKMPKVARNFLQKVPAPGPAASSISYENARKFATNLSTLTREEAQKLTPSVLREVANMHAELNKSIAETAKAAGKLDEYQAAMREYARYQRLRKAAGVAAAAGAGTAAAALGGKALLRVLGELQ